MSVVARYAALAWIAACSYDLDRFVGSKAAGGAGASAVGSGGAATSGGSTAGSGGAATGGMAGGSSDSSTGGSTGGTTAGSAGDDGGGAGGAGGVGGGSGASGAGAGGAADAGSPDTADAAPNDGSTMMGDEDVHDAPADAAARDVSAESSIDGACMADCGSCTSTVECSCASYNGHVYRFCTTARSFTDAQFQCAIASMRLARIDDLLENAWVRSTADTLAMGESWIGIQDPTRTLKWEWTDGTEFWSGGAGGSAVGGLFNAWASGHPTGQSVRNCASMLPSASSGQWSDRSCTSLLPYVCELY